MMHRSKLTSKTAKTEKKSTALFPGAMTSLPKVNEKSFFRFVDKNPFFSDNDPQSVVKSILSSRKIQRLFVEHRAENFDLSTEGLGASFIMKTDD